MVPQPMVEEVTLPFHAAFKSCELLPVLESCFHAWFLGKHQNRMQMVGHEQTKAAVPDELVVIVRYRGQDGVTDTSAAKLIFPWRRTVDGDEKVTAFSDPLWDLMRKPFTNWQIHGVIINRPVCEARFALKP